MRASLKTVTLSQLDEARTRAAVTAASLDALSPLAVLNRGYALAEDENKRLLRSVRDVRTGATVRLRLADGRMQCRVEEVEGN